MIVRCAAKANESSAPDQPGKGKVSGIFEKSSKRRYHRESGSALTVN
jgi:hypothetical protein